MVEIRLDLKKSLEQNANDYFEKGKKSKKKIDAVKKVVLQYQEKLSKMERHEIEVQEEKAKATPSVAASESGSAQTRGTCPSGVVGRQRGP